jgi:ketosteroid isomerase-like protein
MGVAMTPDSRGRIHEIYSAYAEGRFEYLLDEVVDDEIKFVSNAPLLAAWKASRVDYEFLSYLPLLIVADGAEAAAVVVKMTIKSRATDRVISLMVADFLQFQNGRIIEFRQFMDSFDATEQWLGKELQNSSQRTA